MAGQVACNITFKLDDKRYSILIDTIEETDISLSSTLTTHPVANGDLIADHMYKEPLSLTLKGTFSINSGSLFQIDGKMPTLSRIQSLFEKVKNDSALCTMTKIARYGGMPYAYQFAYRENLVLSQITWTEGINTLGFSFSFTEVMITKMKSYDVNTDDNFLPSVELATQASFAQEFFNWETLDKIVIQAFYDNGFIKDSFIQGYQATQPVMALGGIIGGVGVLGAMPWLAGVLAGTVAGGPPAWVIGAVIAGVAIMGVGIYSLVVKMKEDKKFREKAFENYEKDKGRFEDLISVIHQQVLEVVNSVYIWKLDLGENKTGENKMIAVNVLNDYYILNFNCIERRVTTDNGLQVKYRLDVNKYLTGEETLVGTFNNTWAAPSSFDYCKIDQRINKLDNLSGYYMFLMREATGWKAGYNGALLPTEYKNGGYYLIATPINPAEFWPKIRKVIENSFLRNPS